MYGGLVNNKVNTDSTLPQHAKLCLRDMFFLSFFQPHFLVLSATMHNMKIYTHPPLHPCLRFEIHIVNSEKCIVALMLVQYAMMLQLQRNHKEGEKEE